MGQLDGKVAIVTGSGRGIGREVALRLARDGAAVVVNDLDEGPAKETIAAIEQLGGRAVACNGDVTAKDFGERIVEVAVKRLGGLHVIVNNAGYTWDNVIQKMSDEQWYAIIDVHVTAPFRILRAFAPFCASSSRPSPGAASASCARSCRSRPRPACAATLPRDERQLARVAAPRSAPRGRRLLADRGASHRGHDAAARHSGRLRHDPGAIRRLPPRLGEHSLEILREVGLAEDEVKALLASGATRTAR